MTNPAHRRLRAPQADGTALIDPPLEHVAALVAANRAAAVNRDQQLGLPKGFCQDARHAAQGRLANDEQARANHIAALPLIMSGHQPSLFHPGVWFKNFLLSSVAKHVRGTAINLVVDTDLAGALSIRVPSVGSQGAATAEIPFDAPATDVPWEMRWLIDPELWRSFPKRVHDEICKLPGAASQNGATVLDHLWNHVESATNRSMANAERVLRELNAVPTGNDDSVKSLTRRHARPGVCLSEGRHDLEATYGLASHEVSIGSPPFWTRFHTFAEILAGRHRELWEIYNQELARFRVVNHIRSRSHPVPDLARDGDWHEVPLWLWSGANPRRRRVFARTVGRTWEITDREEHEIRGESSQTYSSLINAEVEGVKLRPRALITTMYARLVLSDLFIHGIGGAKYDELTDEIIRRFFGIEPPAYLTATATFRLPIERPHVTADDVRQAMRRIRDLRYRPESFLRDPLLAREPTMQRELQALADEKREYLRTHTLRGATREVYAGLDRLNRAMHARLAPLEAHLRGEHARLIDEAQRSRLLGSREFSFVLFPEEYLVPRLLELSKVPA
jgi:hypothetical protein